MKPEDFWFLTPIEYYNIKKSFIKNQENTTKDSWEQSRRLAYFIFVCRPNQPKGANNSMHYFTHNIFPLIWDEVSEPYKEEESIKMINRWKNIIYKA